MVVWAVWWQGVGHGFLEQRQELVVFSGRTNSMILSSSVDVGMDKAAMVEISAMAATGISVLNPGITGRV